jgi:mono/diheme cytochrome c family protein
MLCTGTLSLFLGDEVMKIEFRFWFRISVLTTIFLSSIALTETWAGDPKAMRLDPKIVERGRYLVRITGCNDCHTPGYGLSNGDSPVEEWLTGDILGWRGPWGTTYASNLRLFTSKISEDQWVEFCRTLETRPPMPWFNLRDMKEDDMRAVYQFVRSLGPSGDRAPAFVPPEKEPTTPYA